MARYAPRDSNPEPAGELYVRGEQVAGEYLGRTGSLTDDGWFPTYDGGWLDVDGYLYVEGRLDDVIVRGAENIPPGEVEDVLLAHRRSPRLVWSAYRMTSGRDRGGCRRSPP